MNCMYRKHTIYTDISINIYFELPSCKTFTNTFYICIFRPRYYGQYAKEREDRAAKYNSSTVNITDKQK